MEPVHKLATAPVLHGVLAETSRVAAPVSIFKAALVCRMFALQMLHKPVTPETERAPRRAILVARLGMHAATLRAAIRVTASKETRASQILVQRLVTPAGSPKLFA